MKTKFLLLPFVALAGIIVTAFEFSASAAAEEIHSPVMMRRTYIPEHMNYSDAEKLLLAVRRGDTVLLRQMLMNGVSVNSRAALGRTALQWAASCGQEACVKVLLSAPGVDVNAADVDGYTPLAAAAAQGHVGCLRLLLSAPGVQVNKASVLGTPLALARFHGHTACVKLLLAAGAR